MKRMSGLEQMRAARDQREAAAVAPARKRAEAAEYHARSLRGQIEAIEGALKNEVAPAMISEASAQLGRRLQQELSAAISKAMGSKDEAVSVTFSRDAIRCADPRQIERQMFDRMASEAGRKMRLGVLKDPVALASVVAIDIPALSLRTVLS